MIDLQKAENSKADLFRTAELALNGRSSAGSESSAVTLLVCMVIGLLIGCCGFFVAQKMLSARDRPTKHFEMPEFSNKKNETIDLQNTQHNGTEEIPHTERGLTDKEYKEETLNYDK